MNPYKCNWCFKTLIDLYVNGDGNNTFLLGWCEHCRGYRLPHAFPDRQGSLFTS